MSRIFFESRHDTNILTSTTSIEYDIYIIYIRQRLCFKFLRRCSFLLKAKMAAAKNGLVSEYSGLLPVPETSNRKRMFHPFPSMWIWCLWGTGCRFILCFSRYESIACDFCLFRLSFFCWKPSVDTPPPIVMEVEDGCIWQVTTIGGTHFSATP